MYDIASTVSRVANSTYSHTRRIMPEQPWWNTLESSFHKFPDDFELDLRTELTVDGTAAADYLLRTAGAGMLGGLALPLSLTPRQLKMDMKTIGFYRKKATAADPAKFFIKPDSSKVSMTSSSAGFFRFRPDDGKCELLSFDSPFRTVNPALRESYPRQRRNMRAVAQYWQHDSGPRPTICVIHGFMADPYWLNRLFFALPWFYAQGYDILLYTLPHHGRRQSRLSPFSGHGLFAGGLSHLNEQDRRDGYQPGRLYLRPAGGGGGQAAFLHSQRAGGEPARPGTGMVSAEPRDQEPAETQQDQRA